MRKPTFFISSTIYDFRDLRSALKFYLEEQGCTVLASEFNDFTKPLDMHSYDACLASIHEADYFILLIGSRIGGWFDSKARVSITQREYREAYQLHLAGKLKLLTFVRGEVWTVREDRRGLAAYLESITELDAATKQGIANHSSKFIEDAGWLSSFLNEVGRNQETKQAVRGEGKAPSGNWIHVFHTMRELTDAINGVLFRSLPIDELVLRRLLRRELRGYLVQCLVKAGDMVPCSPRFAVEAFHAKCPITKESRKNAFIEVDTELWDTLGMLSVFLLAVQLHPVILDEAITRATFLEFDVASNSFRETAVYEALLLLQREIRRLTEANVPEVHSFVIEYGPRYRMNAGPTLRIEPAKAGRVLFLLDRWVNVIELSRSLIRHMDGAAFQLPTLRPNSPIKGLESSLNQERATEAELDRFLAGED